MGARRAVTVLVALVIVGCGSGRREPPVCEPTGDLVELTPTWDYVPYDPYRDHADQQPSVGAWRDTLAAWTFVLEGYWTDSSTDAITFEFDDVDGRRYQHLASFWLWLQDGPRPIQRRGA